MRPKELAICGLSAVRSRFENDPMSIMRLFFSRAIAPQIGDMCSALAEARLIYRCVEPEELERISGSIHHGGIVAVVEQPPLRNPEFEEVREWARRGEVLLVLDCIGNAHNLGAIVRSAAFFGVSKLVLADHPLAAVPTDATYRVAEGGLEHIDVFAVRHMDAFLHAIREVYEVVGAATRGGHPDVAFKSRKPVALVLGNEEQGLADEVAAECDRLVTIPGSGRVESLNVSAAAAVLLWECIRQKAVSGIATTVAPPQSRFYGRRPPRS
jgi:RNA methyltransferase, TrmH family